MRPSGGGSAHRRSGPDDAGGVAAQDDVLPCRDQLVRHAERYGADLGEPGELLVGQLDVQRAEVVIEPPCRARADDRDERRGGAGRALAGRP
jgi:hypothetical protein